jgi:hypothetical protein
VYSRRNDEEGVDSMGRWFSRLHLTLSRKGDAIGEWLWHRVLPPLEDHLLPTPEDKRRALENIKRDDPLVRLGMTQDSPEVWKSLLWWGIFVLGASLAWYMSFHQK